MNGYNDSNIAITLLANAIGQQAARPQKSSVYTQTTTTPYARPDMIMRRDTIGPTRQNLVDTLRKREDAGYSIANTLASMPQQQGYGTWLGDFARAFGGTLKAPTDAQIARAQADYDAEQKDLAMALAYDKAMGDTQTQVQNIGYDDVAGGGKAGADSISGVQVNNFGRSVGYDPVENLPDYGPIARGALTEERLGPLKYIPGAQSVLKGLSGNTAVKLQSTYSDISDNILSGRVLDFVGKAGSVRVADTPAEQEFIFGPIRNYAGMSKQQLQAALKQSRNNFVASGLKKARAAGMDVSEKELKDWWNSAFSVPEGMSTETMYNVQDRPAQQAISTPATATENTISVGQVRNGYKFKGGDPKKKENWEAI